MAKQGITEDRFAEFASQMARNPHTLAAFREAMDDAQRRQQISERIAALRVRRGLTQPQTAERIGVQLRTYQHWEAGGGTSGENYERLAEVLGVSYDYLVIGSESAPPAEDILARLDRLEDAAEKALDLLTSLDVRLRGAEIGRRLREGSEQEQEDPPEAEAQ